MDGIIAQLRAVIGLDVSDFKKGASSVKSDIQELKSQAQALGTALTGAFTLPLVGAAKLGAEFVQMKQSAEIAFGVLLKNGEAGKKMFQELQAFAAATPFDLPVVVQNTQRLVAMGFAAKDATSIMRVLGDTVAGVKGDSGTFERIALALGQIRIAGTLKTQDVNQLLNAGVNVWGILSSKLKKSQAEVKEAVEKGAISSKIALEAIMKGLDGTFGGTMAKMGQTWQTTISNLQDNASQTLGALFEPAIKAATGFVQNITNQLGGLRDYFLTLSDDTRKKIVAVIGILAGIGPAILAVNGLATAFAALTSPVGLVVAAVAAFGIAYTTNFLHVRDITNTVVSSIEKAIGQVGPYVMLAAQFAKYGFDEWVKYAKAAVDFYAAIPGQIGAALKSIGGVVVDVFKNAYEGIKNGVNFIGDAFRALDSYFNAAGAVSGGLAGVFARVWNTISALTANGVQTVVSLIGSMLSKLGEMTGATKLVDTVQGTVMALQTALSVVLTVNKNKIDGLMAGIKTAVGNYKLPDWKGFSGGMTDAGASKEDKKAKDKAERDAKAHAKRLAEIQAEIAKTIFDNAHNEAEHERRELALKVTAYRKAGVSKIEIDKFVASEQKRIHDAAQKKIDEATAQAEKNRVNAAIEASRGIVSTIDNLFDAHLISYKAAESEILAAMHLVSVGAKEEAEIFRSGDEGQILLLKKLNEVRQKMHDEEMNRAKTLADFQKKYNLVYMGKLGVVPIPKNYKPKPTKDEIESAEATKKLGLALQDAQEGFSKANSHAGRYDEVLARLNLDYKKLTDEQKRTLAEIVKWDEGTAKVEAYKRKMQEIKGEAKGILSQAFEGAIDGSANFFDSIRQSFKRLLVQIAAEWAANEVIKALLGVAGLNADGLRKDSEKARNNMIVGATAVTAAAAALSAASASFATAGIASAGAGAAIGVGGAGGAAGGVARAAGAAGASKILGAGALRTLGYVGLGLTVDQLLFKGEVTKTITGGIKKVGKMLGFAEGGRPPVGEVVKVGEKGPELVQFDQPARVYSNRQSQSIMGGAGGGVNFNGPVTINDKADTMRVMATIKAKRLQQSRMAL